MKYESVVFIMREIGEWVNRMETNHLYEVAMGYVVRYLSRLEAALERESDRYTDFSDDPEFVDKMKSIVSEYLLRDENILTESNKRLHETARSTAIALYNAIRDYEAFRRNDKEQIR